MNHKIRGAIQAAREILPENDKTYLLMIGSAFALGVNKGKNVLAYTDGATIFLSPILTEYSLPSITAVLLHELAHIVLKHSARANKRGKRLQEQQAERKVKDWGWYTFSELAQFGISHELGDDAPNFFSGFLISKGG